MCLAIPGKIVDITGENPLERQARVSFGGVIKKISLAYVPEAQAGDYVIVHAGFALEQLDEEEAQRTFAAFQEAGLLDAEGQQVFPDGEVVPGSEAS
jgi:hydrogenase expression/formation protein HypC